MTWYGSSSCLISIEHPGMITILPRRQVHDTVMKKLHVSTMTYRHTISHHTPRCKIKLDASIFYPFASFTWLLGLS